MINHPRLLCLICLLAMWGLAVLGASLRNHFHTDESQDKSSLGIVVSATLTLLGLIISFTFSMATTRYDQRKLYEEQEANAIGTEYVRADLLPDGQAGPVKELLRQYLDRRIQFYQVDYGSRLVGVDAQSTALQGKLWKAIQPAAAAQPTPVTALVVSGMNDVLNSQGYTQYEWWNRIPLSAWWLLIVIALFANLLVGYATKRSRSGNLLLLVLPIIVSVSFFLVADIDSPRGGVIRIQPRNLMSLSETLGNGSFR